jgi:hypothetical protein
MEKKYYSLDMNEDSRLTKIFRVLFGLICLSIAIFWLIYNFVSARNGGTLWITVGFILAFGFFQIYAGFGLSSKFIELGTSHIKLKKNSILPAADLHAEQIERIELYPLKVHFSLRNRKMILLRFGISVPENVEMIKADLIKFAETNNIILEIKTEEI